MCRVIEKLRCSDKQSVIVFGHGQFMRAVQLLLESEAFRSADYAQRMRLFHEAKAFENTEKLWCR